MVISEALSVLVGKASIHLIKESAKTNVYLSPFQGGMCIKSVNPSLYSPLSLGKLKKWGGLGAPSMLM